ncbi:aspartate kinase [Staphylospora marina]|uniref:aspartate kinase n=1 Tax=Staphylospora marina TaxID=2490858 RepID=UPI000F5BD940|nr:aspartate kinase [Staphylospora marina]
MSIVVQKFGGTSVGSPERIRHVAGIVARTVSEGHQVVVVVSAMGHTTDELVKLAGSISRKPSAREMDMLLSTGEQVSIALLAMALHERGHRARSFTGWQAGIRTDDVNGKATVRDVLPVSVIRSLERGEIPIVAGFQGISPDGEITTLGRGGSDTTAVVLAAALKADRCEIYTDVTGVFTADPRVVPAARKMDEISYEEMLELAHLGAGVLHPRSVETALLHGVPLFVRSSFQDEPGTLVKEENQMESTLNVRGIAHDLHVARIKVLGLPNRVDTLPRLFGLLAEKHINVDIIVQSEHDRERVDVSFSVDENEEHRVRDVLESARDHLGFERILTESGLAKVSAVGVGMITRPGVAATMFNALSEAGIHVKMVSTSDIKISCVVDRDRAVEAANVLHEAFGLGVDHAAVSNR